MTYIIKGKQTSGFTLISLLIIFSLIVLGGYLLIRRVIKPPNGSQTTITKNVTQVPLTDNKLEEVVTENITDIPAVSVVAEGLDTPWALDFLPEGGMLVTERKGTIRYIEPSGNLVAEPIATLPQVKELSEGGLHGIAVHPEFAANNYVYLYYTYDGNGNDSLNRVVRMVFRDKKLTDEKIMIDAIPGASNHDGGRIKFGPDKYLYITTGDAQEPSLAQNRDSLAGKILRVDDEGNPAPENPFNNRVYSLGHRNPQGITWDSNGTLWQTEHGPSGFETGNDEVNKIESGKNYGWPEIRGTQTKNGMESPVTESGRGNAWAPAGVAYINGKIYFAGLRGAALYEVDSKGKNLKTHFKGEFGRLREVVAGPDGLLYISTSNLDGRGSPKKGDDKILRINPKDLN